MKYRNQFMKYKLHCHASPDGGEGGGGNNGGEAGGESGGESNDESNLTSFDNMWSNNDNEGGDPPATPQAVTVIQQDAPKGAEDVFNDHVAGIDFTSGVDVSNIQAALQNGDTEAFGKAIRSIGENAYRQSMIDSNKIIKQAVNKAKQEMTTNSETATATERAVSEMNSALPYTKEPMYKPVAEAVFTRFLEQKGMTVDKAIQKTGEYFTKFSGDVTKHNPKSPSSRPSAGFGGIAVDSDGNDDQDWMGFLGHSE